MVFWCALLTDFTKQLLATISKDANLTKENDKEVLESKSDKSKLTSMLSSDQFRFEIDFSHL